MDDAQAPQFYMSPLFPHRPGDSLTAGFEGEKITVLFLRTAVPWDPSEGLRAPESRGRWVGWELPGPYVPVDSSHMQGLHH